MPTVLRSVRLSNALEPLWALLGIGLLVLPLPLQARLVAPNTTTAAAPETSVFVERPGARDDPQPLLLHRLSFNVGPWSPVGQRPSPRGSRAGRTVWTRSQWTPGWVSPLGNGLGSPASQPGSIAPSPVDTGSVPPSAPSDGRPSDASPPAQRLQLGPSEEHLAHINGVAPLNRGYSGRGVRIGFLDAHFRGLRHPAFDRLRDSNRMIALRDFTSGRQSGNHGSGVTSVAVGYAPGTLVGPAYDAEVLGATTEYTQFERNVEEENFAAGLAWLVRRGVDVVNVSVGYTTFDDGERSYSPDDLDGETGRTTQAVDWAADQGVVVVVSAGNSGCAEPDSCWYYVNTPADADSAITVGAVEADSSLASFSSRGPTADGRRKPDVVVQGTDVVTAWEDRAFARVGGTSYAAPQVTGIVAQMLQIAPKLEPTEVRRLLRQTASQSEAPDNEVGWGIVDADAAMRAAEHAARATPPSTLQVEAPYPDPVSERLTIPVRVPTRTGSVRFSLHRPDGHTVLREQRAVRPGPNWLTIDVQSSPVGLYVYRIAGAERIHTGTVAILR